MVNASSDSAHMLELRRLAQAQHLIASGLLDGRTRSARDSFAGPERHGQTRLLRPVQASSFAPSLDGSADAQLRALVSPPPSHGGYSRASGDVAEHRRLEFHQLNSQSFMRLLLERLDNLSLRIEEMRSRSFRLSLAEPGDTIDESLDHLTTSITGLRRSIEAIMAENTRENLVPPASLALASAEIQRQAELRHELSRQQERAAVAASYVSELLAEQEVSQQQQETTEESETVLAETLQNALDAPATPSAEALLSAHRQMTASQDSLIPISAVRVDELRRQTSDPFWLAWSAEGQTPTDPVVEHPRSALRLQLDRDDANTGNMSNYSFETISRRLDHFNNSISELHTRLDRFAENIFQMQEDASPILSPPSSHNQITSQGSPRRTVGIHTARPTLLSLNAAGTANVMDSLSPPTRQLHTGSTNTEPILPPLVRTDTLLRVELESAVSATRQREQQEAARLARARSRQRRPETHGSPIAVQVPAATNHSRLVSPAAVQNHEEASVVHAGDSCLSDNQILSSHAPLAAKQERKVCKGVEYRLCYGLWLAEDGSEIPKDSP
ncbi:hypothetical protein BCR37DRAFT_75773 [Protomyces lactucae-debilis]|uniref:Uncharacterized protein n=1 Tax=Protomyces lactucae-debilis TaxID=2754530 RepID=A0A1Y2F7J0_PROLT|nr:uncharacterized protein BCR37DRAFT_75773 [Protomyces lactucae-debilis]ORY79841.1 hypothetical protein BCR37DRAFT_75773 [Protomyces lactucae-debilis]